MTTVRTPTSPLRNRRCWAVENLRAKHGFFTGALLAVAITVMAQPGFSSPATGAQTAPEGAGAVIPLAEVAVEAEAASARVRDMRSEMTAEGATDTIANRLPALARQIDVRVSETRKIIVQRPAPDVLDTLEADWRPLRRHLAGFTRELTDRLGRIQHDTAELDDLAKVWDQTGDAARNSAAPSEVLRQIQNVVAEISAARDQAQQQRSRLLTVQTRVAAQDARIADALAAIARTRDDVLNHLFIQDSAPIWSVAQARNRAEILNESTASLARQTELLDVYAARQTSRFFAHLLVLLGLTAGIYRARSRARASRPQDPTGWIAAPSVFSTPIAAAFLLSSVLIPRLYPEPPRLLWATLGFLALVPSAIIVARNSQRVFHSALYALLAFYLLDQIRTLAAAVPLFPRVLFLAEMLGATGFLLWHFRRLEESPPANAVFSAKAAYFALAGALMFAAGAFAANVVGYVTLGNVLGNALLSSAYFGLILLALIEILDALLALGLRLGPLQLLNATRRHGALLQHRIRAGLWWLGAIAWVGFLLRKLLLRDPLFAAAKAVVTAQLTLGSLRLSLGDILAFVLTVWAAFLFSRFVRFLLDEEVYPRIHLASGLPYAVSTMLHYLILFVGFVVAVAALGIDMTKVTILAGAFSVGVGLGLQNIFNNFVSGIILLFERPVKIGDVIQIDDASGMVEHIGIRASIIRTNQGSEIIVPNGKLISERVINWTLSNREHSIALPVAVAPGADPNKVVTLLERAAGAHPLIAKEPPPQALVVKLGPDSVAFELRAWTDRLEQWMQVRSELAIRVSAALAAENIAIR